MQENFEYFSTFMQLHKIIGHEIDERLMKVINIENNQRTTENEWNISLRKNSTCYIRNLEVSTQKQ